MKVEWKYTYFDVLYHVENHVCNIKCTGIHLSNKSTLLSEHNAASEHSSSLPCGIHREIHGVNGISYAIRSHS